MQPYPREVMTWTDEAWYRPSLSALLAPGNDFAARENDYVVNGTNKVGGNAQALSMNPGRFLHHTSFLWRVHASTMAYLKHPAKAPQYREARDHLSFVKGLSAYVPRAVSRAAFVDAVVAGAVAAVGASSTLEAEIDDITNAAELADAGVPSLRTEPRTSEVGLP